jgi:hypothetical protein
MRKIAIAAGLVAAAAFAVPAQANEGHVEARGGIYWTDGYSQAIAGVAAGYDWDLGTGAFVGGEVSGDKVLDDNTRVTLGLSARVGGKTASGTKFYGIGGYQTKPCGGCVHAWSAGVGAEVPFGTSLYGKVVYRHFFVGSGIQDSNAAVAGLGVRF